VVIQDARDTSSYLLLDGHLRIEVLRDLQTEVECLVSSPPFQCQNCFAKKKPWTGQEMEFIVVLFFGIVIPSGWVEGINLPASQTACEKLTASIPTDARYREHLHCIVKVGGNANYSL
jgi:hypothetical protein